MSVYALCPMVAAMSLYVYIYASPYHPIDAEGSDADTVRTVLDPADTPTAELLAARSIPNKRLVRAFGLGNTFVSSDISVHKAFRTHATRLISGSTFSARGDGWVALRESTADAARAFLPSPHSSPSASASTHRFDVYAEAVTLRAILTNLFDVDITAVSLSEVSVVTEGIGRLWGLSKGSVPLPAGTLGAINERLMAWMPEHTRAAFPYPLDIVVPIYETLWRVVAVAIAVAVADEDGHSRAAFADLLENPSQRQFARWPEAHAGPSAEALVAEVLRLHPPTRRIKRAATVAGAVIHPAAAWLPAPLARALAAAFPGVLTPRRVLQVADIEAAQRDAADWGADADVFDAMRFHPDRTARGVDDLFAFGFGPLKCVAKKWAPMAAGVIVAAVLGVLEEGGFEIECGEKVGGRDGWAGWAVVKVGKVGKEEK